MERIADMHRSNPTIVDFMLWLHADHGELHERAIRMFDGWFDSFSDDADSEAKYLLRESVNSMYRKIGPVEEDDAEYAAIEAFNRVFGDGGMDKIEYGLELGIAAYNEAYWISPEKMQLIRNTLCNKHMSQSMRYLASEGPFKALFRDALARSRDRHCERILMRTDTFDKLACVLGYILAEDALLVIANKIGQERPQKEKLNDRLSAPRVPKYVKTRIERAIGLAYQCIYTWGAPTVLPTPEELASAAYVFAWIDQNVESCTQQYEMMRVAEVLKQKIDAYLRNDMSLIRKLKKGSAFLLCFAICKIHEARGSIKAITRADGTRELIFR